MAYKRDCNLILCISEVSLHTYIAHEGEFDPASKDCSALPILVKDSKTVTNRTMGESKHMPGNRIVNKCLTRDMYNLHYFCYQGVEYILAPRGATAFAFGATVPTSSKLTDSCTCVATIA